MVIALIILVIYPYTDDPLARPDLPRTAVPLYIDLGPQTATTTDAVDPPAAAFEAPLGPIIVPLSDAELTGLLRQSLPSMPLSAHSQEGRLLLQGRATDSIQADAWLGVDGGRLQLRLRSLVWRGHAIPRPLLGILADQVNGDLTKLFSQAEVGAIEAHDGEIAVIVRPLSQAIK